MFEVDAQKKHLVTFEKSGCCYRVTEELAFVGDVPVPVFRLTEDARGDAAIVTKEAREAAEAILETMKDHRDPFPPEDASADYSGQLRLRLPKSLHERISQMSSAEGVSINTLLLTLIAEGFGRRSAKPGADGPSVKRAGAKRKAVA